MDSTLAPGRTPQPGAERRVKALLAAAAARLEERRLQAWLFSPHPGAHDLEPAVLAWYSDRLLWRALAGC